MSDLISDRIDILPHFIDLVLGYGRPKSRSDSTSAIQVRHQVLNLQSFDHANSISLPVQPESKEDW
jgi:hypothetical protein